MAKKKTTIAHEFMKGLWDENPVLKSLLGLCPVLAVTNSAINGLAMGLATTFVLLTSSIIISSVRNLIPNQVRIPSFIVVIAAFVTVADRFLAAFFPLISKDLGPYVPIIEVNCIILGRQEAFSSKNTIFRSILDSAGMGVGFILVLIALGGFREILGSASFFGITVLGEWFDPWMVMILPGGAFLGLGIFIGLANWINDRRARA
jgi:electron transport complex protein RnfE